MLAAIVFLALGATAYRGLPETTRSEEPHEWLQQFVGEWTATSDVTQPGGESVRFESTECVRPIGKHWTLAEGTASQGDMRFTSIMTLGYDPRKEEFVGTYIDSMQTHLWTYRGSLDAARKVLTLETEGPGEGLGFADESGTSRYREVIELRSADEKAFTSSIQDEDGAWHVFQRTEYRRRK